MKKVKFLLVASLLVLSVGMTAQSQDTRPSPPKMKTPEEIAKMKTDRMQSEIGLTDKQYKKVYKYFKKDSEYRQSLLEERFSGDMPPMGGGPGMGGPGMGGPGMGGPGNGGPGGMGRPDGAPSQGEMGKGQRPEGRPEMRPEEALVSDEYLEKQEAKLKKILTADQYTQWRSKHPSEQNTLPPMEMKEVRDSK